MKSRMPIMLATIAFCVLAPLGWPAEGGLSRPAKFEPPDHKTILIIGQTKEEFADYVDTVRAGRPGGYMFYTSLNRLEGLTSPWKGAGCNDAGVEDLQDWVDNYPKSVGQVGLYIVISYPVSIAEPWTPISGHWRRFCARRKNPSLCA